jgi:hypothetical protein
MVILGVVIAIALVVAAYFIFFKPKPGVERI